MTAKIPTGIMTLQRLLLIDGKPHQVTVTVNDGVSKWFVDGVDQDPPGVTPTEPSFPQLGETRRDAAIGLMRKLDEDLVDLSDDRSLLDGDPLDRAKWLLCADGSIREAHDLQAFFDRMVELAASRRIQPEPEWFEPNGDPVEIGQHAHYQIWDHVGRKWDDFSLPTDD